MSTTTSTLAPPVESEAATYDRVFWLAYIANLSLVTANALTFRFAELVAHLGGTEKTSGAIVSTGVIGAIVARFLLGQAIDHYGTRKLWIASSLLFLVGASMFLFCQQLSWELYVARVAFASALAGMFTCSIVHVQNRVPASRRTEVIGSLGTSGFAGMIFGTQLGDIIFNFFPGNARFTVLFGGATALGLVYLLLVSWLTHSDVHERPHQTYPAHRLIFHYWPGNVVLAGMMMGLGFTVVSVFLTRYTTFVKQSGGGIAGIGTFFIGYASSAFLFRVAARNWGNTVGRHKMILLGLIGHAVGQAAVPFVTTDLQMIVPSICCGWGHALLFPAVVSIGAGSFPRQYRGSGTTIVLGFTEIGAALSAPVLGAIIDQFSAAYGAEIGFRAMFFTSSLCAVVVGTIYALTSARHPDVDRFPDEPHMQPRRDDSKLEAFAAHGLDQPADEQDDGSDDDNNNRESMPLPFPHLGRNV